VEILKQKTMTISTIAMATGGVVTMLGGWSAGMKTLFIFMVIDYISGIVLAGVFHKSTKTESGKISSEMVFGNLFKKGMILLVLLIAHRLDLMMEANFIRDTTIIAYTISELVSIIEKLGLMGIPIPSTISKGMEALQGKEE
jgi:toxin secretion/phage lysis holin